MKKSSPEEGAPLGRVKEAGGIVLGRSENKNWIEVFYEGDLMHTETIDLPSGMPVEIYVEEIPHKTTVYEYSRTTIYFDGPCDIEVFRDGNKIIVRGGGSAS